MFNDSCVSTGGAYARTSGWQSFPAVDKRGAPERKGETALSRLTSLDQGSKSQDDCLDCRQIEKSVVQQFVNAARAGLVCGIAGAMSSCSEKGPIELKHCGSKEAVATLRR